MFYSPYSGTYKRSKVGELKTLEPIFNYKIEDVSSSILNGVWKVVEREDLKGMPGFDSNGLEL